MPGQQILIGPRVVLDTSILRGAGWRSAAIESLFELARSGEIDLVVPEMAYEERRTQWREEAKKKLLTSSRHARSLADDPLIDAQAKEVLDRALAVLAELGDGDKLSERLVRGYFDRGGATIEPGIAVDGEATMKAYLSGDLPFKEVKARDDIPDGYIFQAVKRLAQRHGAIDFLCADGNLGKAAAGLPSVTVHDDLAAFMAGPVVQGSLERVAANARWAEVRAEIPDEWFEETAGEFVRDEYMNILERVTIRDRSIPSDGHEATISMFYDITDFNVTDVSDFGNGWVQIECNFQTEVVLSFMIYRSEAYDVPDWVFVSHGDPEEDHYFEAEGERAISVSLTLAVKMHIDAPNGNEPIADKIEVSGGPDIQLFDY
ncbi:PIN domain-containing protein [Brevundimonas vesicularis]|uniref:PIN domain-containing protein n=1 Tax=Brevundimonas vesicularis TaxID=41276 RepID=UPI00384C5E1E